MALITGFDVLTSSTDTFSDWLNKTNEMINLMRDDVVTANSSTANTVGNARILGEFTSNTVFVFNELSGGDTSSSGVLTITSNVSITAAAAESTIENDLRINGDLHYQLNPNNYVNLIPENNGNDLGNTTNRWDAFLIDVDCDDVTSNSITTDYITVNTDATFPPDMSFTGNTQFENIIVSNDAYFGNLSVSSLIANGAALTGTEGQVDSSSDTIIDTFDISKTKGFKYIIQGEASGAAASIYAVEIMCAHNGTTIFFTRYGEVSNNYDVTLTPRINGSDVELVANCPDASVANVHTFNMVKIEAS